MLIMDSSYTSYRAWIPLILVTERKSFCKTETQYTSTYHLCVYIYIHTHTHSHHRNGLSMFVNRLGFSRWVVNSVGIYFQFHSLYVFGSTETIAALLCKRVLKV